jgi:hypothetical protein
MEGYMTILKWLAMDWTAKVQTPVGINIGIFLFTTTSKISLEFTHVRPHRRFASRDISTWTPASSSFIDSLFNDAFSGADNIASNKRMIANNELERMWKEAVVAYLRHCPGICLERLRKTTKTFSQDRRFPGRDLNPGPSDLPRTDV